MKSKRRTTIVIFWLAVLLAVSIGLASCGPGQFLGPTLVPSITPVPTLGIGSTMVSAEDGMLLVYVPAGEFLMGSTDSDLQAIIDEKPQHVVYLDAFWIDQTEVTQGMYARCVASGQCGKPTCVNGGDDYPVICVEWVDANDYCAWAGRQLPTEAQWEKAARGTDGRIYPWGNEKSSCEYAVMDDGNGNCGKGVAVWPVASKPGGASPYGALDMAGNVWEWVLDWQGDVYYRNSPHDNPTGPESGKYRISRGGGWYDYYWYDVRAASRHGRIPTYRDLNLGFRCVSASTP